MAAVLQKSKTAGHIRSNSLPSRTHPLNNAVEEQLRRLRSSEATSSSSSATSVCRKLGGLKDLYDSVNDWLQLPLTQQVLSNKDCRECLDGLLDVSLQTLDVCSTVHDILSEMKESLRELESSLRRTASANELSAYTASRKKMKKVISRTLESLKGAQKKQDIKPVAALSVLREAEQIGISVFESLLCFLSKPKTRSNNGWSLISKVVTSKRVSCEAAADANEAEELDSVMLVLKSRKDKNILMHGVQKQVEALESSIWEIEEVTECVFRCLVKTRVSLLNILDH